PSTPAPDRCRGGSAATRPGDRAAAAGLSATGRVAGLSMGTTTTSTPAHPGRWRCSAPTSTIRSCPCTTAPRTTSADNSAFGRPEEGDPGPLFGFPAL